jgi:hypothetical protein
MAEACPKGPPQFKDSISWTRDWAEFPEAQALL